MDFAIFNVLIAATTLSPVSANTVSYGTMVLVSYALNKQLTFPEGGRDKASHEMALFVIINVIGLLLNNAAIALITRELGSAALVLNGAKLAAGLGAWVLKFITFKRWVYPVANPSTASGVRDSLTLLGDR
jgi:putative flippase GtrA